MRYRVKQAFASRLCKKKKNREHLYPVTNLLEQDILPKARKQRNFRITVKKYMIVTNRWLRLRPVSTTSYTVET